MVPAKKYSPIQSFNLFGEFADLPDVVHCETIEARSRLHDWEFTPHRHQRLHQVLLIEQGGGEGTLDGEIIAMKPGSCVNVPAGCVHAFSFDPATVGWVVTIAMEVMDENMRDAEGLGDLLAQPRILNADKGLNVLAAGIYAEYSSLDFARAHILRALCAQLIGLVAREISGQSPAPTAQPGLALRNQFEALVDLHFQKHWSLRQYADELAVSSGHLSRICRQTTGVSASGIIEARLIREARRLLTYTNQSISEVAYELGYSDPAYFSRVFSRATGRSPRMFKSGRLIGPQTAN